MTYMIICRAVTYIFHCNFIRMHCTRWKKRHCGQKLKRSECWYCNAISLLFCLSSHVSTIYNLWRKYMIIVGHSWRQIQSRNYLIQLCIVICSATKALFESAKSAIFQSFHILSTVLYYFFLFALLFRKGKQNITEPM